MKAIKHLIYIVTVIFFAVNVSAQVKVGDNPTTIDDDSILELESTTKGFVPPRMTSTQMNAIPTPLDGSIVYDTDRNCLHQYKSINAVYGWISMCQGTEIITVALENDFNGSLGIAGNRITLDGIQEINTLDGASFNNATNVITLPPGTYNLIFTYEGGITGAATAPVISSYFFDFPSARIHSNQAHIAGTASSHGGSMNYVVVLTTTETFGFGIGRGQGGNYIGSAALRKSVTFFSAIRIKE